MTQNKQLLHLGVTAADAALGHGNYRCHQNRVFNYFSVALDSSAKGCLLEPQTISKQSVNITGPIIKPFQTLISSWSPVEQWI